MGLLTNLKIWKRLGLAFGSLGAILLVLALFTWWGLTRTSESRVRVLAEAHRTELTFRMMDCLSQINLNTWNLIAEKDAARKGPTNDRIRELRDTYRKAFKELLDGAVNDRDKELLGRFQAALAAGKTVNDQVVAWANGGKEAQAAEKYLVEGNRIKAGVDETLQAYVAYRGETTRTYAEQAARTEGQIKLVLVAVLGLGLVLSALMATVITRIYVTDVGAVMAHTVLLAQGDFSVEVPKAYLERRDEFGDLARSYDAMVQSIRRLLRELSGQVGVLASSATELSASSEEMATTTEQIARTTTTQQAGAEHMAAAIRELSASIEEVGGTTEKALGLMEAALEATQRGDEAGVATQEAMQGVTTTAGQIASAITVITEIANQTNLLSLNAAIEAAKAGDQGKGFAVVAEEVRKLAERSASSAKEIARHIQAARGAVDRGAATVGTTVGLLKQIRSSLEQFADQARQVSLSSGEQAKAGAEVTSRVEESVQASMATASATTQISATTREIARTSAELARVADQLQALVQHFRL